MNRQKNILFSRSSALVKSGLESNCNEKANATSENMDQDLAGNSFKTFPKKPQDLPIPVLHKGRARLRNKFSHLLEKCEKRGDKELTGSTPTKVTESNDKQTKPLRASDKF